MDYLATGTIRTSFGLKGYLKIHLFSDSGEHLKNVSSVLLKKGAKSKIADIEDIIFRKYEVLIKFRSIDTPEEGRMFCGWEILIPRNVYPELNLNEYYAADIIGCSVFINDEAKGKIISIIDGAQAPLLEIRTPEGLKLVPFMEQYIGNVSINEQRVDLKVDWILE